MSDWSVTALKTSDLNPKKRLEALFERANTTHVDSAVEIKRYFDIAGQLMYSAKKLRKKGRHEASLLNFLRYQTLVKHLKKHNKYRDIQIGQRAAFDYKLKEVAKNISQLSEIVLSEYKRFFNLTDHFQNQDLEGYQEQRPTVSTVRTFISSHKEEFEPHPPSIQRISSANRGRYKCISDTRAPSSVSIPLTRSVASITDNVHGIRRSIFPTRQVREFDEIYRKRRIVRSHRTIILPSRITTAFSYLSLENTKNNTETVGYLAGKELSENELIVTHLIIPEQVGYSDYFKVIDSTKLIRYLDTNDLLTFGWIHSHPIEIPYLTSSDMHYQSVFESVFPEAIAMVYSPKEMRSATFNLTPNHGLKLITNCRKKGFHTHPSNPPLVMESQHIVIDLYADLTIKDYRPHVIRRTFERSRSSLGRYSGYGFTDMFERMLQVRTGTMEGGSMIKIRQSEVTFVHLDK